MPKTNVLGIFYENVTLEEAVRDTIGIAKKHESRYVVTPNPEISENCVSDSRLREAVEAADYAVADGIGVILASRICGTPIKERVSGYDLACGLLGPMQDEGLSLYLLGAEPGVAELAADRIKSKYPRLNICGVHHGYFSDDAPIIEEINAKEPDVVFAAMGSPRQEIWMHENQSHIRVGVMLGLGGGLDVFAGIVKRAPKAFIRLHMEWLYRLIRQPYRFRRMLKLPRYIIRAFGSRLFSKQEGKNLES